MERVAHWGICDPGVAMMKSLSKDAIRCCMILARFADGRTRVAHPSQIQLAGQLDWAYSGEPDRRRVQNALAELEGAGFVRSCGRHVFDRGRWVNRYLVAPYRDAVTATASTTQPDADTTTASGHGDSSDDAVVSGDTMRSISPNDAVTTPAPSDQFSSNQVSSEQEAVVKESHEDQLLRDAGVGKVPSRQRLPSETRGTRKAVFTSVPSESGYLLPNTWIGDCVVEFPGISAVVVKLLFSCGVADEDGVSGPCSAIGRRRSPSSGVLDHRPRSHTTSLVSQKWRQTPAVHGRHFHAGHRSDRRGDIDGEDQCRRRDGRLSQLIESNEERHPVARSPWERLVLQAVLTEEVSIVRG
jgi:hypothetical protein